MDYVLQSILNLNFVFEGFYIIETYLYHLKCFIFIMRSLNIVYERETVMLYG